MCRFWFIVEGGNGVEITSKVQIVINRADKLYEMSAWVSGLLVCWTWNYKMSNSWVVGKW